MNIFEFYMKFKTDAAGQAASDIKALDKVIDDLGKKGKKRSEDENKQFQEAKKQRKEALAETKEQTRETEKLNESFQSMVNNAVGALTAYTSFSFLKNALVDANNLNLSLKVLQGTFTGLDATQVERYARAFQLSGVSKENFYAFVTAQKTAADTAGRPFNLDQTIKTLRQKVGQPDFERAKSSVAGLLGITPGLRTSQDEFDKNFEEAGKSSPSQSDLDAALKNNKAASETAQTFSKISTEIDTAFSGAVKDFNGAVQLFLGAFQGHPIASAGAELGAGLLTGWLGKKFIGGFLTGGAGIAGAAIKNPYVLGALALAGAGFGAYEYFHSGSTASTAQSAAPAVGGSKTRKQQIMDFWQSQGYTSGQAAGWTANAQAESSFGTKLLGYDGRHFGLYQWSNDRRKKILAATGIDVATANLDGQLAAAAWEAKNTGFTPDKIPTDNRGSAAYISSKFEVPSTTQQGLAAEAAKRADIASGYGDIPQVGSAANSVGSGRSISIKIDDVRIETQASDAAGIAGAVAGELKNQIRMAIANIDDGISA